MWSSPSTPEQRTYFSTHAPKRKVFGIGQVALQIAHIALGFAAWAALYGWAFRGFPAMQPFVPLLAVGSLFTLHVLWATTWATFWYDRLDDRTETDSSWFLPVAIMAVLVLTDKEGATMFFKAQVAPPQTTNTATLDEQFQSKIAAMEAVYERDRARLEEVWQAKARAAAAPHQRNIEGWQRKRATSESDRKFIAGNVAAFTRQRDAAVAKANEGKAEALHQLYSNHEQRKADAESRHLSLLDRADAGNTAEFTRYQSDLSAADRWAWLISLFLVGAAAALSYARVRINVRSGILPERTYSTLDQHGSVLEKFWIALADGTARQMHRASVWLHRWLSPSESLVDFDGNVVIAAGDYNSNPPELRPGAETRPTPPSDGERLMRDRFARYWAKYIETEDLRDRAEAGGERAELYRIHGTVGIGKEDGTVGFITKTSVPDGQLERLYPLPRKSPAAALVRSLFPEREAVILAGGDEPETRTAQPLAHTVSHRDTTRADVANPKADEGPTWLIADVDKWKRYFSTYMSRASEPTSLGPGSAAAEANRQRGECYAELLRQVGIIAKWDYSNRTATYTPGPKIAPVLANYSISLTKKRLRELAGNHKHRAAEKEGSDEPA